MSSGRGGCGLGAWRSPPPPRAAVRPPRWGPPPWTSPPVTLSSHLLPGKGLPSQLSASRRKCLLPGPGEMLRMTNDSISAQQKGLDSGFRRTWAPVLALPLTSARPAAQYVTSATKPGQEPIKQGNHFYLSISDQRRCPQYLR